MRGVALSTHLPPKKIRKKGGKEIKITDMRRKKLFVSSFTFGLWLLHHFVNSTSKETRSDKSSARRTVLVKRLAAATMHTHAKWQRKQTRREIERRKWEKNEKPDYVEEIERANGISRHRQQTSSSTTMIRGFTHSRREWRPARWMRELKSWFINLLSNFSRLGVCIHSIGTLWPPAKIHFIRFCSFLFHLAGKFRELWSMCARRRRRRRRRCCCVRSNEKRNTININLTCEYKHVKSAPKNRKTEKYK